MEILRLRPLSNPHFASLWNGQTILTTNLLNCQKTYTNALWSCQIQGLGSRALDMTRGSEFLIRSQGNVQPLVCGPHLRSTLVQAFRVWICNAPQIHNLSGWSSDSDLILEDYGNFRRWLPSWRPLHTGSQRGVVTSCFLTCSLLPEPLGCGWGALPCWAEPSENSACGPVWTRLLQVFSVSFGEFTHKWQSSRRFT